MSNCPNYTKTFLQLYSLKKEKYLLNYAFQILSWSIRNYYYYYFYRLNERSFENKKKRRKKRWFVEAWRGPRYPDRFCKSTEIPRNWVVALEGRRTRHLYRKLPPAGRTEPFLQLYVYVQQTSRRKRRLGNDASVSYRPIPPEHLRTHLDPIKRPANLFNGGALGDLR